MGKRPWRQALQWVEDGDRGLGLLRDGAGDTGRGQRLGVHGGCAARPDAGDHPGELVRGRLGLRAQTLDRDLAQAVPLDEVAERGVASDDLAAKAVCKAGTELAVERTEPCD